MCASPHVCDISCSPPLPFVIVTIVIIRKGEERRGKKRERESGGITKRKDRDKKTPRSCDDNDKDDKEMRKRGELSQNSEEGRQVNHHWGYTWETKKEDRTTV